MSASEPGPSRSPAWRLGALTLLLIATGVGTPLVGSSGAPLEAVLWTLRLPRLALAMQAGLALGVAGAVFQALFRNPLATPFTLGVSSGASLFVSIGVFVAGRDQLQSASLMTLWALAGATGSILVVYAVARSRPGASTVLLLAGLSVTFLCSAGVVFVQALADEHATAHIVRWMMGSVEAVGLAGWRGMLPGLVVVVLSCAVIARAHRDLDLLMMDEQIAASRGVDVVRIRWIAYFAASAMTAAVVARCGPIAFVGLCVPHVVRAWVGPRHALLLPGCALGGMIFLPLCDTVARNLLPWLTHAGLLAIPNLRELPVGVVTSFVGGLFFLRIVIGRGQRL